MYDHPDAENAAEFAYILTKVPLSEKQIQDIAGNYNNNEYNELKKST